jgi:hypothetical protein
VLGSTTVLIHGSVRIGAGARVVLGSFLGVVVVAVAFLSGSEWRVALPPPQADANRARLRIRPRRMSA